MTATSTNRRPRDFFPLRSRSRLAGPLLVVVAALTLMPLATTALFQLGPDAPSPATGHAQVIAQGVSPLPASSLAWRIVQDTAEQPEQAAVQDRALGFVFADQQPILNSDQRLGSQSRLAPGEAAFVPAGSRQLRASLTGQPVPYYRLGLVPAAEAADAGGDRLILAGDAWNAPAGDQFDIDLIRDVVSPNEASRLPATNGPALVLATNGTIEVEVDGAAPIRLGPGEAANVTGDLSVYGVGTGPASFVAAVLGPAVPPPPAPLTGSITINELGCPTGVTATEAVAAGFSAEAVGGCVPAALAANPVLILAGNQALEPDQPNPAQGTYTWTSLLYSPFPIGDFTLPAGYDAYLLVDSRGVVGASTTSGVTPTVPDPNVLFVDAEAPDAQATLFLFADEPDGGSISVAPFTCPEGMTPENLDSAFCEPATGSFDVTLTSLSTGETRTLTDAERAAGSPFSTWTGLPPGDYAIAVPATPPGYTTFTIPTLTLDPVTNTFITRLTAATPDAQYNLFFLQEGDAGASGSITVSVFDCPPGMTRDTLVATACQPSTGFSLSLYPPTGGLLGMDDAVVQGNVVTWTDLPFGAYAIEEVSLPPGYSDPFAPGVPTSSSSNRVYVATVAEDAPRAEIAVYNLQAPVPAPAPTPPGTG